MKSCSCHTWSLAVKLILKHALWGALLTVRPLGEASYGHQHGRRSSQTEGGQQGAICANERKWKKHEHVSCILCKVYKTVGFISKTKCTKGLKRMKEETWLSQRMNHDKPLGGDRFLTFVTSEIIRIFTRSCSLEALLRQRRQCEGEKAKLFQQLHQAHGFWFLVLATDALKLHSEARWQLGIAEDTLCLVSN